MHFSMTLSSHYPLLPQNCSKQHTHTHIQFEAKMMHKITEHIRSFIHQADYLIINCEWFPSNKSSFQ
jgi:hypothetical protein